MTPVVKVDRNSSRATQPVFVIGCHRSGTNLLYDMLMSAGGFAVYRGYLPIYKMLVPKFGTLNSPANRKRIVDIWLQSKGYRRSNLDAESLRSELVKNARTAGDFMRIVMTRICETQRVPRWALYDADNVLYIRRIKADIPNAIFVHIVRDGRDVALSLKKMGGFTPFFWNRKPASLEETAIYWSWMVRRGRQAGRRFPGDYIEVRYEDLISQPDETLNRLGTFIEHELNYEVIQRTALGRVSERNSSFRGEATQDNPLNRWRSSLSIEEIGNIERLVGAELVDFGYTLSVENQTRGVHQSLEQRVYDRFLDLKYWGKVHTPLGRLINISPLELEAASERLA